MVPKGEEAPAIGLGKALTVFHRHVDAVVLALEESTSGWFLTRAIGKSGLRTRVSSFTMTVPSGNSPVFR